MQGIILCWLNLTVIKEKAKEKEEIIQKRLNLGNRKEQKSNFVNVGPQTLWKCGNLSLWTSKIQLSLKNRMAEVQSQCTKGKLVKLSSSYSFPRIVLKLRMQNYIIFCQQIILVSASLFHLISVLFLFAVVLQYIKRFSKSYSQIQCLICFSALSFWILQTVKGSGVNL